MASYPTAVIGWTGLAAAATGLAAMLLALLAFVFGRGFGRASDVMVLLTAILTTGLGMQLLPLVQAVEPQLAPLGLGLALLGGFLAAFGSLLAAAQTVSWFRAQLYVATGFALSGVWMLMLNITAKAAFTLPHRVVNIGIFAGVVMALGVAAIPGLLLEAERETTAPGISRYVGRAGYLGWLVLLPIWCAWLGSSMLGL